MEPGWLKNTASSYDGNNVQVNRGKQTGADGGTGYGTSITGPQGNTAFRGVGESADGTVAAGRGVSGADGGAAAQGVAAELTVASLPLEVPAILW